MGFKFTYLKTWRLVGPVAAWHVKGFTGADVGMKAISVIRHR